MYKFARTDSSSFLARPVLISRIKYGFIHSSLADILQTPGKSRKNRLFQCRTPKKDG